MLREKKKPAFLSSPVGGETVLLENTGDEVFAGKMLGDGIAVEPFESIFASPCDGTVESVSKTAHAYNIRSKDGLDVLVHIGIDTVELKGEGFTPKVQSGDSVKRGQTLCVADVELIRSKGYSAVTPVIISNISEVSFFDRHQGPVKNGEPLINYII